MFLGSGSFGLPTLKFLHTRHEVAAVVTSTDKPSGRKRRMTPTVVGAWAQDTGLNVVKTDGVNELSVLDDLSKIQPDAAVVIAFGQKLSEPLIQNLGGLAVNLHASLLPKYRGAAPVNWAMVQGEVTTGLSVISLAQRMDAGLVYAQCSTPIDPLETAGQLHDRLADMGPGVVGDVLERYHTGTLQGQAQDESLTTRAPKLTKADGTVDFNVDARLVRCRIHGLTPWPGVRVAWRPKGADVADHPAKPLTLIRVKDEDISHNAQPGTLLEGYRVATGKGAVKLLEVQAPGTRPMTVEDFARGHGLAAGDRLRSLDSE